MNSPIVYAVGIGPGSPELLTPQARQVLESCTVVAGYKLYLDLIAPLVTGKKLIAGAMRGELDRCRRALDAALEGERVAVIGSGDAGIYGMAGLLYELTELDRYRHIAIEVEPGITAAVAAAALAGAPLMNDFAVLSLSDLMTPREVILNRLEKVAAADLVTVLYNPASTRRRELPERAVEIFRSHGGNLPAALVRDAYRDGQSVKLVTLDEFPFAEVQMTTVVIVGNSETIARDGKLYVRRGYKEKYGLEK